MKGANNDGLWNEKYRAIKIIIAPPWWETWWAKSFYVLTGLAFLYWIQSRRKAQRKAKQQRILLELKLKQQKELQALALNHQKKREEDRSTLYANITHEFKTPITVIKGIAERLQEQLRQKTKTDIRNELGFISRNAIELLNLVNQMLALAQLGYQKMKIVWKYDNVVPYLKFLGASFESYAKSKNIRLLVDGESEEIFMDYDEDKLYRIVSNLLSNAIKHARKEGQIIFLFQKDTQGENNFLKMKFKDDGEGIPKDALAYIFDRHYQVKASSQNKEGIGIGLALVKEMTELLGGRISVDSELGKWTEFEVLLPIKRAFKNSKPLGFETLKESELIVFPKKVREKTKESISKNPDAPILLLIEDNEDLLAYLMDCLKDYFEIAIARDGEAGIIKAKELIPDIIISDIMMPKKDGYEVCRLLTEDEHTNHIPIILLTAKDTEADKKLGLELGAIHYLTKPFDLWELTTKVQNLIFLKQKIQLASLKKENKSAFLIKVDQTIEKHISDSNFKVHELADALGMPTWTLNRKLKSLTAKPSRQYLEEYRLESAKGLLQQKDLNVTEISLAVGFPSLPYFSRRFKEKFGYSPSKLPDN